MNNQNPSFMKEIFYRSPYVSHEKQNLFVQSHKTAICMSYMHVPLIYFAEIAENAENRP